MVSQSPIKSIIYSENTVKRALRALICSPFQLKLWENMLSNSVSIQAIAGVSGINHQYTQKILSELTAENQLSWLIQVGILRREVDGQGLTDSFRLTPLGRQLTEKWQHQGRNFPQPSILDRLYNFIIRLLNKFS